MSQPARKPHRRRPPDAWAAVRSDYAAGVPARVAAERGGVSLSALRTRARQEGWRRQDGCGLPPPTDWTPDLEAGLESDPALLADEAWLNAARHLQLGRLAEASAWARMAAHCRRAARDADKAHSATLAALNSALREMGRPVGRMQPEQGEKTLLIVFEQILEAASQLTGAHTTFGAPECKSQAVEPKRASADLHQLHTPRAAKQAAPPARTPPAGAASAHPRANEEPVAVGPPEPLAPAAPPASATEASERARPDPSSASGRAGEGPERAADLPATQPPAPPPAPPLAPPAAPPPWAALHARPEAELSWNEAALLRRVREHGLDDLFVHNRPAAEGRWAGWLRRFPLSAGGLRTGEAREADQSLSSRNRAAVSGTPPACVSHPPHIHPAPRAALL